MRRGSCCVMIERKQTGLIRKVAIKAPILDLDRINSFYLIVFYLLRGQFPHEVD